MIDEKLKDFDHDEKAFVCLLLNLAGYQLEKTDLEKYVRHSSPNLKETFEYMTMEKRSKAFIMIGEALGYLPPDIHVVIDYIKRNEKEAA